MISYVDFGKITLHNFAATVKISLVATISRTFVDILFYKVKLDLIDILMQYLSLTVMEPIINRQFYKMYYQLFKKQQQWMDLQLHLMFNVCR